MTPEQICQRSEFLGTQVITRDTGKRIGVVSQLWVDIDRQEVVALSLRENLLTGLLSSIPKYMYTSSIRQIGDVILVDDENVIEDIDVEAFSSLINSEVITEAGEMLGKVRGFKLDTNDYKVCALIVDSIGIPQIPDQILSTYELPIEQIISSGPNRLIVFEGSEEQLIQLSVGVLDRLGIGQAPWERDAEEQYMIPTVQTDKQLGTGTPVRTPIREAAPVVEEVWNEDNWEQPEPEPLRKFAPEPVRSELEQDNWGEANSRSQYNQKVYAEPEPYNSERGRDARATDDYARATDDYARATDDYARATDDYEDMSKDAWDDDEDLQPYKPPRVNIPEKTKTPEYEGEIDY